MASNQFKCPMCSKSFLAQVVTKDNEPVAARINVQPNSSFNPNALTIGGLGLNLIPFICESCGYIAYFHRDFVFKETNTPKDPPKEAASK